MAASGQNVALLCALALPLLIALGTTPRARVSVLLPLVGLYVALAGSGASIVRAGIMASAALVALAASRRSSAMYALLLAAVITLAVNPRSTGDPGWQLSFAAVIGMFVLGGRIARRLEFLPHFAREAIGATVAATLVTAPLLAHQFGAISIAALPANLIVFPVVAPIMWIGMAEAAAEQAAAMSPVLAMVVHLGESAVAPIQALALRWVAAVATHFADPAWAQAQIHWSWPQVAVAYALIALACVWAAHGGSARRVASAAIRVVAARPSTPGPSGTRPSTPGPSAPALIGPLRDWIRALSPASRRAYAAPVIALAFGAAALASTPPRAPDHLTVDFLDVGQGDSVLIRDPAGAAVLFDGGVPEARVDRTLRRLGVRRLSVVVATHQSRDHHAGLLQVVKRFPVGLFLDGRDGVDDPTFIALEREVDRRRIPRRPTRAGQRFHVGDLTIRILWPTPRTAATPRGDPNERATVAIVSEGEFDLLLSADAEAPVLLPLNLPPVEAMKVPHHGSVEDGLPELLRRLRPRVAAIETGRGNRYGHPRPQTLQALRAIPRVYRTDRDGTVELTVTGDQIAIRTHR